MYLHTFINVFIYIVLHVTTILLFTSSTAYKSTYCNRMQYLHFLLISGTPSVHDHLKFLDDCLTSRSRFPSAASEKAWTRFHTKCQDKIHEAAGAIQMSPSDAFWLCLKVFQHLVQKKLQRHRQYTAILLEYEYLSCNR